VQLQQVFVNLFDNAVTSTPWHHVSRHASRELIVP
jgi:hypothetical protein